MSNISKLKETLQGVQNKRRNLERLELELKQKIERLEFLETQKVEKEQKEES